MTLQAFSFPLPETRFFRAGSLIYKFTIRGGSSFRGDSVLGGSCLDQELEEIIRAVLGNLDSLQPFSSAHFNVLPYKEPWKVTCKHDERKLRVYPFSLLLYLEKSMQNEEAERAPEKLSPPKSKRCRRHSSLEDAVLKDLFKDLQEESKLPVYGSFSPCCSHEKTEGKQDPGLADENALLGFGEPQQKCGIPGEVHPGTIQHMGEEEDEADGESVHGSPVRPGMLIRMARKIFPLSLLFGDP